MGHLASCGQAQKHGQGESTWSRNWCVEVDVTVSFSKATSTQRAYFSFLGLSIEEEKVTFEISADSQTLDSSWN